MRREREGRFNHQCLDDLIPTYNLRGRPWKEKEKGK
jgi:hypothetical protein